MNENDKVTLFGTLIGILIWTILILSIKSWVQTDIGWFLAIFLVFCSGIGIMDLCISACKFICKGVR